MVRETKIGRRVEGVGAQVSCQGERTTRWSCARARSAQHALPRSAAAAFAVVCRPQLGFGSAAQHRERATTGDAAAVALARAGPGRRDRRRPAPAHQKPRTLVQHAPSASPFHQAALPPSTSNPRNEKCKGLLRHCLRRPLRRQALPRGRKRVPPRGLHPLARRAPHRPLHAAAGAASRFPEDHRDGADPRARGAEHRVGQRLRVHGHFGP